jgi:hypothetical protein
MVAACGGQGQEDLSEQLSCFLSLASSKLLAPLTSHFSNASNGTKFAGFGGATAFFKTLKTRRCSGDALTKSS